MHKNIIRAVIFIVAILSVFIVSWSALKFLTHKKVSKPDSASRPRTIFSTAAKGSTTPFNEAEALLKEGKRAQAIKALEGIVSSGGGSEQACQSLLLLADIYKNDGNLLKTKEIYFTVTEKYPDYCDYPGIQKKLTRLNMDILFSPIPTADSEIYTVKPGDMLIKIAKNYSTTVELIKKANGLKSDLITPGLKLKVQKVPFSIIVDKSQSTLTLISGGEVIKTYSVSTGKNNSTPTGTFKITDKLLNPVWYSAKAVVSPDSPENVLGSRWMGINTPQAGYGIHGTIESESIGYQCTEGCVRMHNSGIEELFDIVPPGTEVTIID